MKLEAYMKVDLSPVLAELALEEGTESLTSENEEISPLTPTPFEVRIYYFLVHTYT